MTTDISDLMNSTGDSSANFTEAYNLTDTAGVALTYNDIISVHKPIINYADRFLPPLWYFIGFPGNILAFIIWIRPRMRPSSGCYLAALAMGDLVFLILHIIFWLQNTWHIRLLYFPVLCEIFPVIFLASQYLNPLLVLGFTGERYIAICHPFRKEKWCTTGKAISVIVCLILISIFLHVIQSYFWQFKNGDCSIRDSALEGDTKSLWSIWSWITELLVFGLVPIMILVLNLLVIKEAKKIKDSEKKMMCLLKGQKVQRNSGGASATTFMLLAVSFYMIFTTLPVTIMYVLNPVFPEGEFRLTHEEIKQDPAWQRFLTYITIRIIIERLAISHYACNFYIYLSTGQVFRKELQSVCIKAFCKKMSDRIRNSELDDLLATYKKPSTTSTNGAIAHV